MGRRLPAVSQMMAIQATSTPLKRRASLLAQPRRVGRPEVPLETSSRLGVGQNSAKVLLLEQAVTTANHPLGTQARLSCLPVASSVISSISRTNSKTRHAASTIKASKLRTVSWSSTKRKTRCAKNRILACATVA